MVVFDSATGKKINSENISFSSRIERFKWIRQFKKKHPKAKIQKYNFSKKDNTWPFHVAAEW